MMLQIAKTDQNHKEVTAALRKKGFEVWSLHKAGGSVPDLLVLEPTQKIFVLLEVKAPGGTLTEGQIIFFAQTAGAPRHVVYSGQEAIEIMLSYRRKNV